MKVLRIVAPRKVEVVDLPDLSPAAGQLLIDIKRAGICGTDIELFTGEMAYYKSGRTTFPIQIGHEWVGLVREVGSDVDQSWIGAHVTGDTMMGCMNCDRCEAGKSYLCEARIELGITDGWGGALAQQIVFPVNFAIRIPDSISLPSAAMIEPAGNALRCVEATQLEAGERLLIFGAGTIGLLSAQFALAQNIDVHIVDKQSESLELARALGVKNTYLLSDFLQLKLNDFDAVIDATSSEEMPAEAVQSVKPSGRIVLIGLSQTPSLIDTRQAVLRDVTIVGILSASPGLRGAVEYFQSAEVNPEPLISEVIGLHEVESRLNGIRNPAAKFGPKIHVDPWLVEV